MFRDVTAVASYYIFLNHLSLLLYNKVYYLYCKYKLSSKWRYLSINLKNFAYKYNVCKA